MSDTSLSSSRLLEIANKDEQIKNALKEAWYGSGTFKNVYELEEELKRLKDEHCSCPDKYGSR